MNDVTFVEMASGVRIAAQIRGSGPAVLLSGGLGMPAATWEFTGIPDALTAAGFTVISYSARGLAPSSAPAPPYRITDLAADAAAVLAHFDIDEAILVGYSMGCYVTQALYSAWSGTALGIAMIAGLASSPIGMLVDEMQLSLMDRLGELPGPVGVFEQLMTTLTPAMLTDPATVTAWRDLLSGPNSPWTSPDGHRGQVSASYEWKKALEPTPQRLSAINTPTLVVAYEHDVYFPPSSTRAAAAHIPDAEFHRIDGLAHGGLLLDGDRRTLPHLVDFCTRVSRSQKR